MGKISFFERLRQWIAGMGFKVFLWGNRMSQEEYWREIAEQERVYAAGPQKSKEGEL